MSRSDSFLQAPRGVVQSVRSPPRHIEGAQLRWTARFLGAAKCRPAKLDRNREAARGGNCTQKPDCANRFAVWRLRRTRMPLAALWLHGRGTHSAPRGLASTVAASQEVDPQTGSRRIERELRATDGIRPMENAPADHTEASSHESCSTTSAASRLHQVVASSLLDFTSAGILPRKSSSPARAAIDSSPPANNDRAAPSRGRSGPVASRARRSRLIRPGTPCR
jgi:hypothetical protein